MRLAPAIVLAVLPCTALGATVDLGPPFGAVELVDEVDAGNPADGHALYEDPAGASKVATVLGRQARVLTMQDTAQVFAYKLGAGKGLVAGRAYVLQVEYPEDTGRQIVLINRGADEQRTLATGQTIGDAREGYTYPSPESLKYPLSGKWESHRTLFFLHDRFQGIKGGRGESDRTYPDTPATGFWVIVGQFRKKDSPLDAGAAVARIRLFSVPAVGTLFSRTGPVAGAPRRLFWREEMSDSVVAGADPAKRGVSDPVAWYEHKMQLARLLGMNVFTKDLLEFGHDQLWDSSPYGGNAWFYQPSRPDLWEKLVDRAKANGLEVLPYYEYAGAMGAGSGGVKSYGYQHHCRPLGDRSNDAYTDVWWSESACIDVTEQAARDDVQKLLDATVKRFKDKAAFAGAWFRTRPSSWPIGFADATLARFGTEANGGVAPTRAALASDPALLSRYYAWWFGKRREYLLSIRDWLRANVQPGALTLFTAYPEEALRVPTYADWKTPTDDVSTWTSIHTQPGPWQWRFAPVEWSTYVASGAFLEMQLRMTPPTAQALANKWAEPDHSAPPADPARYASDPGVLLTLPFSRLFTVSANPPFETFRSASGLAMVRHFNLNEEDGQSSTTPEGVMSKRVGYFVSDVDRAGPYSMLAEARAVAYGDPTAIGYLSSSSFNRGFPEYARAFNEAFLALPAVPGTVVATASTDPEIVVRRYSYDDQTWFAAVNTGLTSKTSVAIKLGVDFAVRDAVTGEQFEPSQPLALPFYPGQLYAFAEVRTLLEDGGMPPPRADASAASDEGGQPQPITVDTSCGCSSSGATPLLACALAALAILRRRSVQ